jgi:hypothetical protein
MMWTALLLSLVCSLLSRFRFHIIFCSFTSCRVIAGLFPRRADRPASRFHSLLCVFVASYSGTIGRTPCFASPPLAEAAICACTPFSFVVLSF